MLFVLLIAAGGIAWLTKDELQRRKDLANDAPCLLFHLSHEAPQRGLGNGTAVSPAEFEWFAKKQAVLVKTWPLIERALVASRETENSLGGPGTVELSRWVESRLRVDFPAPQILRIAFDCPKRDAGVNLLNALAQEYLNESRDSERRALLDRMNHLDLLAKELSNTIRRKQHEMRELSARIGGGADERFIAVRFRAYESALSELQRLRLESFRMQADQEFLRTDKVDSSTDHPNALLEQLSRGVAINEKTRSRFEKEVLKMEETLNDMTKKSIEIPIMEQELAAIEPFHRQVTEQLHQLRIELVEWGRPTTGSNDTDHNATWSRVWLISSAR